MVETEEQIREAVAKELLDLADRCEEKTEKFRKLGDHSAVNLGAFLTTFLREAAKDWSS